MWRGGVIPRASVQNFDILRRPVVSGARERGEEGGGGWPCSLLGAGERLALETIRRYGSSGCRGRQRSAVYSIRSVSTCVGVAGCGRRSSAIVACIGVAITGGCIAIACFGVVITGGCRAGSGNGCAGIAGYGHCCWRSCLLQLVSTLNWLTTTDVIAVVESGRERPVNGVNSHNEKNSKIETAPLSGYEYVVGHVGHTDTCTCTCTM